MWLKARRGNTAFRYGGGVGSGPVRKRDQGGSANIVPPPGFVSASSYAESIGVSRKSITIWADEGMPHEKRGTHLHVEPEKADLWRRTYGRGGYPRSVGVKQPKSKATAQPVKSAAELAFERKAAADAERAEIRLQLDRMAMAREAGQLVDRAELQPKLTAVFASIRRGLMEAPLAIAIEAGAQTGVPEAVLRSCLDKQMRALLAELAREAALLIE